MAEREPGHAPVVVLHQHRETALFIAGGLKLGQADLRLDHGCCQRRLAMSVEIMRREMNGISRFDDEEKSPRRAKTPLQRGPFGNDQVLARLKGQLYILDRKS